MSIVKNILKWLFYFLLLPLTYLIVSLLLSAITVNNDEVDSHPQKTIYLSTNGVHINIVLAKGDINRSLLSGIKHEETEEYLSFGWGDAEFYLNTPTWNDLTFKTAFKALFLKSSTLMHITRYKQKQTDWIAIKVTESELKKLNAYLLETFKTDENGLKIRLKNKGYAANDDFYKANGSYSCFKTSNTWANTGFKKSGLKACLWTPFDFGLLNKYE
ncbi:DUF2459 domain-containing protein [Marixanthomonas spongiae]|uniref:DUF2459 domain-containing protein n=1 Tax=Marixanthomonas spongiae TaxID=2174845 RepID=A0A2U0HYI3_9FLAO|nr:DUF2459 domain-containing protein [Marixanthomonas spongiae]PVW13914.1 DUF2459 domain-containing protein [Marixanthomonas spongiae]